MERKPTIIEINRLSTMLESTDLEMQDLGLVACEGLFGKDTYPMRSPKEYQVEDMKSMLATKAYVLGFETGADLLRLKALGLWK